MNKRIKTKHQHHEDALRKQIEEEVQTKYMNYCTSYLKRIDYLVGGNNELASLLKVAENRCRELEKNLTQWREGCVPIPNATADCIILEENF